MRWRPARRALSALLDRHLNDGATVAIVGAGNGQDLPLRSIRRARRVDLIDLDARALRRASHLCLGGRATVRALVADVTGGAADLIVRSACGEPVNLAAPPTGPVGAGPYDFVIADHVMTQLLYPALVDAGLPAQLIDATLLAHGDELTDAVVARLHAAAPTGLVIHVDDLLCWWPGHQQPFAIDDVLTLGADPGAALALTESGERPYGCDPRAGSLRLGATVIDTAFWRWPFAPATDYLVCASVMRTPRFDANQADPANATAVRSYSGGHCRSSPQARREPSPRPADRSR